MPVSQRVIAAYLSQHGGGSGAAAPVAPANTVAPVVSGTATVGQTLSCTTGTWTGDAVIVYTYQWQRAGVNIGSATSSTYLLVAADQGNAIRCVVTGTNAVGNASANSNATASVAGAGAAYAAAVLADTPVAYWKCTEGSGTTLTDSGSVGLNMTTHASPSLTAAGPMTGEKCITFVAASSQYADVTFGSSTLQQGDTFSVEVWFKRGANGAVVNMYSAGQGAGNFVLGFLNTNEIYGQVRPSGTFFISTPQYTDTNWHHFVLTKSGSTRVGYLDGSSIAFTGSNSTVSNLNSTMNLGRLDSLGQYYDGSLAHVAYYNTALSAGRVAAHYAARA